MVAASDDGWGVRQMGRRIEDLLTDSRRCPMCATAVQASLDGAAVERLKDDDAVSLLFNVLSQQYPQVGRQYQP